MGWRRDEVWLEAELRWFRESADGGAAVLAIPPLFGPGSISELAEPIPNGLAESRRRRAELRSRRSARRTRAAAVVLGPAVALSLAGSRLGGGGGKGAALEEDPPSLTVRLGQDLSAAATVESGAPPGVRGTAGAPVDAAATLGRAAPYSPIEWRQATSHGLPYSGSLEGGTRLPTEGADWVTWNPVSDRRPNEPWRLHGHERTIKAIVTVLAAHRAAHPSAPRVLVGDISLRDGGPMNEHRSHQNGLDVDVYYPRLDRALRPPFTVDQVDRVLAQDLLDRFLAAGAKVVFVGYETGLRGPAASVVPYPNHENHMHVRFAWPD